MKNDDNKKFERLVEQMMRDTAPESPSPAFTQKVMSEVLISGKRKSLVYQPVLRRRTWLIIFAGIVGLFIYSFLNLPGSASTHFNFNFTFFAPDKLERIFQSVQISFMTVNVIVFAVLLILIQIFFLKKYLDKRFEN